MSDNQQKQNKPKLPAVLLMVSVIAAILGGFWLLNNMSTPNQMPEQAEVVMDIQSEDQVESNESASAGAVVDEASSTEPVKINLEEIMAIRSIGDKSAPIKIYEYASLTCSHCAHFHNDIFPVLKEKYIDTGKVYFEFRGFPLNDPALRGEITARCLPVDKYEAFVSLLFKTQDQWAGGVNYMPALKQNSKLAGLSEGAFEACHENNDIKLKFAQTMQEAQDKWKIESTPTFIINDGKEVIKGSVPLEEFERAFRKVTNNEIGEVPAVE